MFAEKSRRKERTTDLFGNVVQPVFNRFDWIGFNPPSILI